MNRVALIPFLVLALAACDSNDTGGSQSSSGSGGTASTGSSSQSSSGSGGAASSGINPEYFLSAGLVTGSTITKEACTLSNGTATTCYRISVKGVPSDHSVGPFCPRNISDGADVAGIWPANGKVNDLTGAFIANLATFYNDPAWQLHDTATGKINVTDTQASCQGAAKPNVEVQYQNHCVECSLDYVNGGVGATFLLPVTPVPLASPKDIGGMGAVVGVALNGVVFDPPAPVQAILAAHTIAAFDDCGGHINLADGYHYHGASGCSKEIAQTDGHAPLIGYAMDGYALHAMENVDGTEPGDLDDCRGHTDASRGYHYHVASAGENMFIGCFHGEQGSRSQSL